MPEVEESKQTWILDSTPWIPDFRYWIPGFWIPDSNRNRIPNPRFPDSKSKNFPDSLAWGDRIEVNKEKIVGKLSSQGDSGADGQPHKRCA